MQEPKQRWFCGMKIDFSFMIILSVSGRANSVPVGALSAMRSLENRRLWLRHQGPTDTTNVYCWFWIFKIKDMVVRILFRILSQTESLEKGISKRPIQFSENQLWGLSQCQSGASLRVGCMYMVIYHYPDERELNEDLFQTRRLFRARQRCLSILRQRQESLTRSNHLI